MKKRMRRMGVVFLILMLVISSVQFAESEYRIPGKSSAEHLLAYGIVRGDQHGNLNLHSNLTRGEMTVLLSRLYGAEAEAAGFQQAPGFADDAAMDAWVMPYVAYARKMGWMKGDEFGIFNPKGTLQAEEVAVILRRLLGYSDAPWGQNISALQNDTGLLVSGGPLITRGEIFEVLWGAISEPVMSDGKILLKVRNVLPLNKRSADDPTTATASQSQNSNVQANNTRDRGTIPNPPKNSCTQARYLEAVKNVRWLDPSFSDPRGFVGGMAAVYKDGSLVFIGQSGNSYPLKTEGYREVGNFRKGRCVVSVKAEDGTDKYGYIDLRGEMVIPAQFDIAGDFYSDLAVVGRRQGDRMVYGYIDLSGNVLLDGYADAKPFREGFAAVKKDSGRWGFVSAKGVEVFQREFDGLDSFSGGLALFVEHRAGIDYYGYLNRRGDVVIPAVREYYSEIAGLGALSYSEGIAIYAGRAEDGTFRFGYQTDRGEPITEAVYRKASPFSGGLAVVQDGERVYMIDRTGEVAVDDQYEEILPVSEMKTFVKKDGTWGIFTVKKG